MSGNPNPIDSVFVDGVSPDKSDVRSFQKARAALVVNDASELRTYDLASQQLVFLKSNGRVYRIDTSDTTTADDGSTLIRDSNGIAFSLVTIDGLDGNDGSTWFSGAGAPSASPDFGVSEDFYLNTSNGDIYKKTLSGWGAA